MTNIASNRILEVTKRNLSIIRHTEQTNIKKKCPQHVHYLGVHFVCECCRVCGAGGRYAGTAISKRRHASCTEYYSYRCMLQHQHASPPSNLTTSRTPVELWAMGRCCWYLYYRKYTRTYEQLIFSGEKMIGGLGRDARPAP